MHSSSNWSSKPPNSRRKFSISLDASSLSSLGKISKSCSIVCDEICVGGDGDGVGDGDGNGDGGGDCDGNGDGASGNMLVLMLAMAMEMLENS